MVLLWLAGTALRSTILALPPVLPRVTDDLALNAANIGLLTALPSLLFALAAVPGAVLVARIGPVPTLVTGLVLNALGAAARGLVTSGFGLEAATAFMCLGVAVMQPALPPLVRSWAPSRIGFATAVYTNGLLVGEVVPTAWVPQPVLPVFGGGWRASLVLWALPVLVTALLMFVFGRRRAASAPVTAWWPNWEDWQVWRLGLMLGGVNATYFGLNGFIPAWLNTTGWPSLVQPSLFALNMAQIPASLLLLATAGRMVRNPIVYGVNGVLLLAGVAGVVLMPGPVAVAWAALAGFAGAMLLTLSLALPSLLGEARDVPRLSAGMFTVSYGLAMASALLGGQLWHVSGQLVMAFIPFALTALLVIVLGATLRLNDPAAQGSEADLKQR